ncbi:uL15 family ribosomal protein [Patescibacteria group bacterium]|nr:uL15 family ribosomal protein [Patescibacteria group bacterium]
MQLHELKIIHKNKSRRRIGRGGKKGTYSGKGVKGQKSRAGKKPRLGFAGGDTTIAKRLPKQRGSVGKVPIRKGIRPSWLSLKPVILNLSEIKKIFSGKKGEEIVSPKTLVKKGLIGKIKGRVPRVKILAGDKDETIGDLKFKRLKLSKSVLEKIKKPAKKL